MAKVKHESFRNVTVIIGSYEVYFDQNGIGEVTPETIKSISGIKGFTALKPEPEPKQEVKDIVEEKPLPITRQPITSQKNKRFKKSH